MRPFVRPAKQHDVLVLAHNLRKEDEDELRAATGLGPLYGLQKSFEVSRKCFVAADEAGPWCIGGVAPGSEGSGTGHPWLMCAKRMKKHARWFIEHSHFWIDEISEGYDFLINAVDARNTVHIRWLKWAGFTFAAEPTIMGVEQRPFYMFHKVLNKCAVHSQ